MISSFLASEDELHQLVGATAFVQVLAFKELSILVLQSKNSIRDHCESCQVGNVTIRTREVRLVSNFSDGNRALDGSQTEKSGTHTEYFNNCDHNAHSCISLVFTTKRHATSLL